jgi:predicted dienelactone hydrolase
MKMSSVLRINNRPRARVSLVSVILWVTLAGCAGNDKIEGTAPADPLAAGPYPVGVTRIELYDADRGRVLLTEIWYPAAESVRGQPPAPAESYLPPELAVLTANATIPLVAVRDVPLADGGPFPLVEFSHGNGGIRFQNTFQMEHLASHGFVVAAPDHPGNTFFSNSGTPGEHAVNRPLDMSFLADELVRLSNEDGGPFEGWVDAGKGFGVTGHSFGAFTSLAAASMDDRFVAVLPMAFGGPISETYSAATLLLLATQDKTIGLDGNDGVRETFAVAPEPRYIGEIVDAGHYSFSFACQTGLGIGDGDGCKTGTRLEDGSPVTFVSDLRVWDIINGYSAALFGRYINGIEAYDAVLDGNIDPEIMHYMADAGL